MEVANQEKLLCEITEILFDLDIEYFITGGMAVSVWGRPRSTLDIDIIIKIPESKVNLLVKAFKKISEAGYADEKMAKGAICNKGEFNFIDGDSGLKVDFWVAKNNERSLLEFKNKKPKNFAGQNIYFSSPEDLILNKLLWRKQGGREKHIEGAKSIMNISKEKIDTDYLKKQAEKLNVLNELKAI